MFIDFCTSCGNFDNTTFTPSEKETIQNFSDIVTTIYTKAKEQTDSYNDCKANVLADFICDLVAITNPRSQGCPRFQSGEELANSVGKINA